MSDIKRYVCFYDTFMEAESQEDVNGEWVKYEDYAAATQWQPIETAPKDGTDIITYRDSATVPIVRGAFWLDSDEHTKTPKGWYHSRNSVGFYLLEDINAPTHWMPLPQPPTK